MEKLLLDSFLAGQELDIVNQEDVHGSIRGFEMLHAALGQGGDEIIHEFFRSGVNDFGFRVPFEHLRADGLHQMGLAQTHAAVDEQRVVHRTRFFADRDRSRVGQLIVGADNESVKGVFRIQGLVAVGFFGRGPGRFADSADLLRRGRERMAGDLVFYFLGFRRQGFGGLEDVPIVFVLQPLLGKGIRHPHD